MNQDSSASARSNAPLNAESALIDANAAMQAPRVNVCMVLPKLELRGCVTRSLSLANELVQRQCGVAVISPGGQLERTIERSLALDLRWGMIDGERVKTLSETAQMEQMTAFGPDVLHVSSLVCPSPWRPLARKLRIPVLATVHSAREAREIPRADWFRLMGVIASSQDVRETLVNEGGVDRKAIEVIPPGAPVLARAEVERRVAAPLPPVPVIACLGPLEDEAGLAAFLAATRMVIAHGYKARFLIVGDGPGAAFVRRECEDSALARYVVLASSMYDYDGMFSAFDIVVSLDDSEDSALYALQAMGAGTPVVASGSGGHFEMIADERTGLLYQLGNPAALATKIEWLLFNDQMRRQISLAGWQTVQERFNIAGMADATLAMYASCLERAHR